MNNTLDDGIPRLKVRERNQLGKFNAQKEIPFS